MNSNPESTPQKISPDELFGENNNRFSAGDIFGDSQQQETEDQPKKRVSPQNIFSESDTTGEQDLPDTKPSEGGESPENEDMGDSEDSTKTESEKPEKDKSFWQIPKTFWNTASKQVTGLMSGMVSALNFDIAPDAQGDRFVRGRESSAEALDKIHEEGEEQTMEGRKKALRFSLDKLEEFQQSQEGSVTTTDDIEDWVDGLNYVGNAIAQTAAQIPLSLATGGATSIGQEIGIIYTDQVQKIAEKEGIDPEQVIEQGLDNRAAASAYGVAAGALDYIGAKGATQAVPFKDIKRSLGQRAIGMFQASKIEGLTEGGQSIIEQFGASHSSGDSIIESITGVDPNEAAEEGMVGFIGGGGVQAGTQALQSAADRVKKKAQESDKGLPEGWSLQENGNIDLETIELFQPEEQVDQPVEFNYDPEADPGQQLDQLNQEQERLESQIDDEGSNEDVGTALDKIKSLKEDIQGDSSTEEIQDLQSRKQELSTEREKLDQEFKNSEGRFSGDDANNVQKLNQEIDRIVKEESKVDNQLSELGATDEQAQQEQGQDQETEANVDPFGNIERNQVDNPFLSGDLGSVATSDNTMVDGVDGAISTSQTAIEMRNTNPQRADFVESLRKDNQGFTGSEEVVQRKEDAFGIRSESIFKRSIEKAKDIKKSFFRRYTKLEPTKDAVGRDILRQYEAVDSYAEVSAHNAISNIVSELDNNKYRSFIDALALPDIVKDVENGLYQNREELPFGYENAEQVQEDLQKVNQEVENDPDIQKALKKREKFVNDLKSRMVKYDLLPEKVLDDNRYFHRQVTKYFNNPEYNKSGLSTYDVRIDKKGFQKKRQGGTDFNTAYHEAEFEWVSQAIKQLQTVETLNRLNSQYNIKEQLQREASVLSEDQGQTVDWRDLVPEDHTIWSPEKGNKFYQAHSVEDRVIDDLLSGRKEFEESDMRDVLAVAKKDNWVIPDRVAQTLDEFQVPTDQTPIGAVARNLNTTWKQWTLISPPRIFKYNANNTSGDLDIALAYDWGIVKHTPKAAKDLYRDHKNRSSLDVQKELEEMVRLGVIESGLTVQEIPDITKEGIFKGLIPTEDRSIIRNSIKKYWRASKDYTNMRENVLRVAAFRRFKERLEAGEENIYGASEPDQVDQIENIDDKAAKLARELIGDYGNLSEAGQYLRENMIPFYSWMEINTPRYYRMMKNLPREGKSPTGRGALLAGKKLGNLAVKGGKYSLKITALFAAMKMWNKTFFTDEEEDLLDQRGNMQLILGRNEDGTIKSIRFEGALADALEWFDLTNLPNKIQEYKEGDKTAGEIAKETAKAPINRYINASVPIPKTIAESLMGASLYPDAFNPMPIRDSGEHASRLFSLDFIYNFVTNKPTPPGGPIEKFFIYRTNPEEAAYYHTKRLVVDYLKDQGRSFPRIQPTERQNALYYYKQSAKWGERDKAKYWFDKYKELGGSESGVKQSIQASEPLNALSGKDRTRFLKSLDKEEIDVVKRSQKWYDNTYKQ